MNERLNDIWKTYLIGSVWINDRNYELKILDIGIDEVWVLHLSNGNKCSWNVDKFLELYNPSTTITRMRP